MEISKSKAIRPEQKRSGRIAFRKLQIGVRDTGFSVRKSLLQQTLIMINSLRQLDLRHTARIQPRKPSDEGSNFERIENGCVMALNRPYQMEMYFDQSAAA